MQLVNIFLQSVVVIMELLVKNCLDCLSFNVVSMTTLFLLGNVSVLRKCGAEVGRGRRHLLTFINLQRHASLGQIVSESQ